MQTESDLFDHLVQQEQQWLKNLGTDDQPNDLLDDGFLAVSSAGKFYDKDKLIQALKREGAFPKKGIQFRFKPLADDLVLLAYICAGSTDTYYYENEVIFQTSIWKYVSDKWCIVYHQGTGIQ